ncbi:ABC-three component system protein [Paenibacillus ginsengarvi]|uniref:CD-NTase associated protein 4-like DNA endonuclease domain-containing protein n=1 Tax=Paenibacillus ginsengarvi TaxID=400777 RepID=A0A3B0C3S4_9BACL|nr:ABC-three component system protein [Paenibacillus ginsengarvi]RKN79158.1 hypothetical protein D7M11_20980 [Paenibacillus ginsengarvi]
MTTFQEKTTADNKSIGFDYQYYYFLYQLLGLEEGEKIGIEVKDDVHLELPDNAQVLIQVKHTVQQNSQGQSINITERDIDIWKSLSNWTKMINDPLDGRKVAEARLAFIENTSFILVSNKSNNQKNTFLKKVKECKQKKITITDFRNYLALLIKGTSDPIIKGYMEDVEGQSKKWLELFISKLEFELEQDDLIAMIKKRIKAKLVKESKIEDVFNALDSNLRKRNYINTKKNIKNVISFAEFYRDYHVLFDKGRNDKLPINNDLVHFNKSIDEQLFITQLADIHAIDKNSMPEKLRLASQMLRTNNHKSDWLKRGLVVKEQLEHFDNDCVTKWSNTYDEVHRDIKLDIEIDNTVPTEKAIVRAGLRCLDEIRKKELVLDETPLDSELSNGQFYQLSNIPTIGWRFDWKEKYKNEPPK